MNRFADFSEEGLKQWVIASRQHGISAAAVNSRITGINAYLRWAGEPHKLSLLKESERILPTYSLEQIQRLIDYKPKSSTQRRLHAIVLTILDTGIRVGEAITIQVQDLDFDNMLVRIQGKGNKEQLIPFSIQLRKVLWKWKGTKRSGLLFASRSGGALTRLGTFCAISNTSAES